MIKLGVSGAHGKMGQTITDCIQANEGVDLGISFGTPCISVGIALA